MSISIICVLCYVLLSSEVAVMEGKRKECSARISTSCKDASSPQRKIETFCNDTTACIGNGTCSQSFKLSIIDQQLFALTMKNAVMDMLHRCCGVCAKCSIVNRIEDISHSSDSFVNSPDIIFPVIGYASIRRQQGFYFIPSFQVPSSYYFTVRKSTSQIMIEVVSSCIQMWPLLIVCLILAIISGFIIWVLEARHNVVDFRPRFHTGLFDGFWWSFVSMTTVGFGDKVPRTFFGQMYAVFWVFIGITICSIFTASLTTEIMKAKEPIDADIAGRNVGVLKHRLHDIAIVAQHGGILHTGRIYKTMRGIDELINMLSNKTINGFIIDKNTYFHFSLRAKQKERHKYIERKLEALDTLRTEKFLDGEKLQCGMLVKSEAVYNYFNAYFQNNRIQLEACNSLRMNTKKKVVKRKSANVFGSDGPLFKSFLYYTLAILGGIFCLGAIFEGRRYCVSRRVNKMI